MVRDFLTTNSNYLEVNLANWLQLISVTGKTILGNGCYEELKKKIKEDKDKIENREKGRETYL